MEKGKKNCKNHNSELKDSALHKGKGNLGIGWLRQRRLEGTV